MINTISKHYNDTVCLTFNPVRHHYTVAGKTVDGCTSILGVINKPALVAWSANMAAKFIDANLEVNKPIDEIEKLKLVNGCKTAHRSFKEQAADIGKLFHAWADDYAQGKNPAMPTNPMLLKAVEQYLIWIKENKVVFKDSEKVVYSKKYNYAGTLDIVAEVNGKLCIIDLKTSSGIWDEYLLQVAAYKWALQEEFPEQRIDHVVIVRCGRDGSFEVKEVNDYEPNMNAFVGALILYRRLKAMKFDNFKKQ
jgi:hypothetical protein